MMRVADYIIDYLNKLGVKHIFQVTGRGSLFLNDAVAKNKNIEGVSLHHEQSCSFAAIAYAEKTKNIGVCLVSTGCASTNAITGTLCAWQDGIPCIYISGQNILKETTNYTKKSLRTYGQQEFNITNLVEPITKFSMMLKDPKHINFVLDKAVKLATTGRKGPVWIDVPLDLQSALVDPLEISQNRYILPEQSSFNQNDINYVVESLKKSKRPIVLIGKGIKHANALKELKLFIEENSIPLVFSASAPDIYASSNNLSFGSVGSMGCSRSGNFAIQNSDLVLVIGSRLNSLTTGEEYCKFARKAEKIIIDIDKNEHDKETIKINKFIELDAKIFLKELNKKNLDLKIQNWVDKCTHWKNIFSGLESEFRSSKEVDLYELAYKLGDILNDESTLVTDSGLIEVILPSNVKFKNGVNCIHSSSQGSMGFALPAAIGVQKATTKKVFAVIGDGSIMMNLQELSIIGSKNLPIKIFLLNNDGYHSIRQTQKNYFPNNPVGCGVESGLPFPSFEELAKGFNIKYFYSNNETSLNIDLEKNLETKGPVIHEIKLNLEQVFEPKLSSKKLEDGTMITSELEDMAPFLSNEIMNRIRKAALEI